MAKSNDPAPPSTPADQPNTSGTVVNLPQPTLEFQKDAPIGGVVSPDPTAAKGRKPKGTTFSFMDEREPKAMEGLTEGRMVHYVLPDGKCSGQHRAAVVSLVHDHGVGMVNLSLFLNGDVEYDAYIHPGNHSLVTSVPFDPTGKMPGTWHFIERT